jgi:hypothetical protein
MTFDYVQLAMVSVGIVVLSVFGFYAVRLLSSFKRGMLAEGWKRVTIGATFLVVAQFPILGSGIESSSLTSPLSLIGTLLRFIGIVFLILGFKAQHEIWRVDNKEDLSPVVESHKRLER